MESQEGMPPWVADRSAVGTLLPQSSEDSAPFSAKALRKYRQRLRLDPLEGDLARVDRLLMKELGGDDDFLNELTSHLAGAGGKRLRPVLVLCGAYAAQRGPTLEPAPEEAIIAAAAIEALHLCTLYHDDVMDEATLRRGVPTANSRWGNTVAVIGGDILLARAFRLGASLGSAHVDQLAQALEELCAGQAGELSYLYDPSRDEAAYDSAIAGKTASLMSASLRLGGLAAALEPGELARLSTVGHELGFAFQLIDDLLDILGTPSSTGKPTAGADIAEGVYTLPVILELPTNAQLRELLDSPPSAAEAEQARRLVMAGGGLTATAQRARAHVDRALAMLDLCEMHPAVRDAIERLGDLIFEPVRSLRPGMLATSTGNAPAPEGDLNSPELLDADEPTRELITGWLRSYVAKPHAELGRPGAVCPFVGQALAMHKVSMASCDLGAEPDLPAMTRAVERAVDWFSTFGRADDDVDLSSLVVAFPDLARQHWHLIDEAHSALKTRFVANGLMLGQFHPDCAAPAAHNPDFPVNRSPIPLMVIRRMAPHDILFLEDDRAWVGHYVAWLEQRKITVNHPLYRQRLDDALGRRP